MCSAASPPTPSSSYWPTTAPVFQPQLTNKYNLGKGTVLRLLRGHNVQLRKQPLTANQVSQAIQLYQQGLSLAYVGERLGRDQSTIHDALRRAGVPRRDPHQRRRREP